MYVAIRATTRNYIMVEQNILRGNVRLGGNRAATRKHTTVKQKYFKEANVRLEVSKIY